MNITLKGIGKRYNRDWIFRNLDYRFESGTAYAILGANGSGKSTLLQVIAGNFQPSEGNIEFRIQNTEFSPEPEAIYKQVSFAAPYLDLFEEYTLTESIDFHKKMKPLRNNLSTADVIGTLKLEAAKDKLLRDFSSGMKQRVRLGLAILSDTPLLLLDEPASNLDRAGTEWYQQMVSNHSQDRIIVVCSNRQEDEYRFCKQQLVVEDYKPA